MKASVIQAAMRARPFKAFRVRMKARQEFIVSNPRYAMVVPSMRLFIVADARTKAVSLIDSPTINSLVFMASKSKRRRTD